MNFALACMQSCPCIKSTTFDPLNELVVSYEGSKVILLQGVRFYVLFLALVRHLIAVLVVYFLISCIRNKNNDIFNVVSKITS